ncbi:MAG: DUF86 domain-containing protein [Planctomycetaceae bacterium]
MVTAAREILEFVERIGLEQFTEDKKTLYAVLHNFAVLGEAARHVPPDVATTHPDVPWSEMRKMRNIAIHVYHGIDVPTLWDTIHNDLPPLLTLLEAMLAELDATLEDQTP